MNAVSAMNISHRPRFATPSTGLCSGLVASVILSSIRGKVIAFSRSHRRAMYRTSITGRRRWAYRSLSMRLIRCPLGARRLVLIGLCSLPRLGLLLLPRLGRVKLSLRPATCPGSRGSCEGLSNQAGGHCSGVVYSNTGWVFCHLGALVVGVY